jgi:glycoprotein endo-alpha-1,2-mannosidase
MGLPSAMLVAALLVGLAAGCERPGASDGRPLVGAYYYVWYDAAEWRKGYLGAQLAPPVGPLLGEYASGDPGVAAQHIAWASEFGIDVFVVSWEGRTSTTDGYLRAGLLSAPNLDDVRFALLYESLAALDGRDHRVHFDAATIDRLVTDIEYVARRYFPHPRYLRLEGRPVLFLYVSRNFEGRHRDAIAALRRRVEGLGQALYLVGDEVFWHAPRGRRLRLFDAVTAYNMYDWPRRQFAGYAPPSTFLPEVTAQYRRYAAATSEAGVAFVPSVLPGYNDRGVRLAEDHYVLPRRLQAAGEEGGVFAEGLKAGLAVLGKRSPLLLVTSFNEWHEWTQIEPTATGPATTEDASGAHRYTAGLTHQGYGFRYLEVLRDATVALSGRLVAGPERRPVTGALVRALRDGTPVATALTDSAGRFRFARRSLPPGDYELVAGTNPVRRRVTVGTPWVGPIELDAGGGGLR